MLYSFAVCDFAVFDKAFASPQKSDGRSNRAAVHNRFPGNTKPPFSTLLLRRD
jgi:hypothetical protein